MTARRPFLIAAMAMGVAGPAYAWQWGNSEDPASAPYHVEAAFQPGYALSRRGNLGVYWGELGWRLSEHSVLGLNGGYFGVARDARQETTATTTEVQDGDNRSYYLGPFWQCWWENAEMAFYVEAGAGPMIQQTRTITRVTDHANGDSVQVFTNDTTNINATMDVAAGLDFKISDDILIGLGLRDVLVLRQTDPSGYPADKVRPLNSFIPYASFRLRY